MSNVSESLVAWRRDLEQTGLAADDVTELESHLVEEMEALQKSGLRPDESFVIASRRLGYPAELAAEYSKNDVLMSWRRPARLVLWGLLVLQVTSLLLSATFIGLYFAGLWDLIGVPWLRNLNWISWLHSGVTLSLLWWLAAKPQGAIGRLIAALEGWILSRTGAILLILIAAAGELANVLTRVWLYWLMTGTLREPDSLNVGLFSQLLFGQLVWTIPIVGILVVLVRTERGLRLSRAPRMISN